MPILLGTAVGAAAVWFKVLVPFGKTLEISEDLVDREWVNLTPDQARAASDSYRAFTGDLQNLLAATQQDAGGRIGPIGDLVSPADQQVAVSN